MKRTATARIRAQRASRRFWAKAGEVALVASVALVGIPAACGFGWCLAQSYLMMKAG